MAELGQRFRSIEAVLAALPEQRADIKRALLSDRAAEDMAHEIQRRGFAVSPSTIRSYRRAHRRAEESPQ